MKDLTTSVVDRQNILNNNLAIFKMQDYVHINGYYWNEQTWFLKQDIADFFNIDIRTLTTYVNDNKDELAKNGYIVLKGKNLKSFKSIVNNPELNLSNISNLSIFNFRSLLNIAMLLNNNDKAREIRSKILDVVLQTLVEKSDGNLKYINRRDPSFLEKSYREATERKKFTNALNLYVDMNQYKYAYFTDKIYTSIFKENAKEYRNILKLKSKDKTRDTMYTEVLNIIASFEAGIAFEIEKAFNNKGAKLTQDETDRIIDSFSSHPLFDPLIKDARVKMASRDNCFRQAYHKNLEEYITSVDKEDFEKFIGEKSREFKKQLEEHKDILERMKNK